MGGTDRTEPELARSQRVLRALLVAALLALGLYILSGFLRALVWAVVLAIALWPLFVRAHRRWHCLRRNRLQ